MHEWNDAYEKIYSLSLLFCPTCFVMKGGILSILGFWKYALVFCVHQLLPTAPRLKWRGILWTKPFLVVQCLVLSYLQSSGEIWHIVFLSLQRKSKIDYKTKFLSNYQLRTSYRHEYYVIGRICLTFSFIFVSQVSEKQEYWRKMQPNISSAAQAHPLLQTSPLLHFLFNACYAGFGQWTFRFKRIGKG